jgi:dCMP deaminase
MVKKYFMDVAKLSAKESYCKRLKVGATLVRDNYIIASGRNGTISGLENNCEEKGETCIYCSGNGCDKCDGLGYNLKTSDFTLHAEQNIISFCAKHGITTKDTILYITHSPCKTCSKLIAQSGIRQVVYEKDYRDTEGIEFLKRVGVEVICFGNED